MIKLFVNSPCNLELSDIKVSLIVQSNDYEVSRDLHSIAGYSMTSSTPKITRNLT